MRQQPITFRNEPPTPGALAQSIAVAPVESTEVSGQIERSASETRLTTPRASPRASPFVSHLQTAWRVRQFAASSHFGTIALPRMMTRSDMAVVQQAIDRLGPFGGDRIDNYARLHAAIVSGTNASAQAVLTLVRHRIINPNQRGRDGDTLLHSLIEYGRLQPTDHMRDSTEPAIGLQQRLSQLIAAGVNPNATDREGRTALERILLSDRPDWHPVGKALLAATPRPLHLHMVKKGPTLLHRAARRGEIQLVERWLALGLPSDIGVPIAGHISDPELITPLWQALKNHSLEGLEIARLLMDDVANPADPHRISSWSGISMLHHAALNNDRVLIKGWIAAGLPLNNPVQRRSRITALMLAVRHNPKRAELLTLIAKHSDINARDRTGATALHHAASDRKMFPALTSLITAGANLDIRSNNGTSALEVSIDTAFRSLDATAFWVLAAHGANLDLVHPITGNSARNMYNFRCWKWGGELLP